MKIQKENNFQNKSLSEFLSKAAYNDRYRQALQNGVKQYQIKSLNITKLTPQNIHKIYSNINQKVLQSQPQKPVDLWHENQLRIFVWILVVYVELHGKDIQKMEYLDWSFFLEIFRDKNIDCLQYQSLCLIKRKRLVRWEEQETAMLIDIMEENDKNDKNNRWSDVAKKIYINSGKKYFRTAKQCREHWINHLDPTKTRSKWTSLEDYELIKAIKQHGKKWAKVAKILGSNRTEHMIKNRYKSLINYEIKRRDYEGKEEFLLPKIKQRIESNILIKRYNKSSKPGNEIVKGVINQYLETRHKLPEKEQQQNQSDETARNNADVVNSQCLLQQTQKQIEVDKAQEAGWCWDSQPQIPLISNNSIDKFIESISENQEDNILNFFFNKSQNPNY